MENLDQNKSEKVHSINSQGINFSNKTYSQQQINQFKAVVASKSMDNQRIAMRLRNEMSGMAMGRDRHVNDWRDKINELFQNWEEELRQRQKGSEDLEVETTRQRLASLMTSSTAEVIKPPLPPSDWLRRNA